MTNCTCRELLKMAKPSAIVFANRERWRSDALAALAAPCPELAARDKAIAEARALMGDWATEFPETPIPDLTSPLYQRRDAWLAANPAPADPAPIVGHIREQTPEGRAAHLASVAADITESAPKPAIADTPSQDSVTPFEWGEGVPLERGRVIVKHHGVDRIGTVVWRGLLNNEEWEVHGGPHDGYTDSWHMTYPLSAIRPAPFAPAIGKRVRVVSLHHSKANVTILRFGHDNYKTEWLGREFVINQIAEIDGLGAAFSEENSGLPWMHHADLMLLADAAEQPTTVEFTGIASNDPALIGATVLHNGEPQVVQPLAEQPAPETKPCPECDGTGEVVVDRKWSHTAEDHVEEIMGECPSCGATGEAPAPGDPAFTLPDGFGDVPDDGVQAEMAELTAAAKGGPFRASKGYDAALRRIEGKPTPKRWRKYTEEQQREMIEANPDAHLELKIGTVIHRDGIGWRTAKGVYVYSEIVAMLKARVLEVK
jgi:hypothetical protein